MSILFNQSMSKAVIKVQGEDAEDYLQSQCTIDLRKLSPGQVRFGLRLSTKGKVLAGAYFIKNSSESFRLISRDTEASCLIDLLEQNVVADEIEFFDETNDWNLLTISGSEAGRFFSFQNLEIPSQNNLLTSEELIAFVDYRLAQVTFSILTKIDFSNIFDSVRAESVGWNEFERRRIKACLVSIPQEIGPTNLPQEGKLDKDCVDFEKGCYLGQEVMARLHAMGKVRRYTHPVAWDGHESPSLPADLLLDNKTVGALKTLEKDNHRSIGIALIHEKAEAELNSKGLRVQEISGGIITRLNDGR